MKKTPTQAKIYLSLAVICMLIPAMMKLYTGETQRLVVASGKLSDPHFTESVVFIFLHNLSGAVGVIVNKPLTEDELRKAPSFLTGKKIPLHYGGPVEFPSRVVVLERAPTADGTTRMTLRQFDEAVEKDPKYLDKIVTSISAGKDEYRVYLGVSGWGYFQIADEFRRGNWASTKLDPDLVFYKGMTPREVWLKALEAATEKRKPRNPGVI
jgi:putative transcriptional regulator